MNGSNGMPPGGNGPYDYGPYGYGAGPGYPMHGYPYPYAQQPPANQKGAMSPSTEKFIRGALIGAAAAYILTNDKVQHAVIKNTVRMWDLLQGGVEEVKERFRDAEAELQAEKSDSD